MYYSSFGILAVILHLILNYEILKTGRKNISSEARLKYRHFVLSLLVFYIADICWGFLVDQKLLVLAYADTVAFFGSMALSLALWTRYVSAFINKKRLRARFFVGAGWAIFIAVCIGLLINAFYPLIFSFTEDTTYIPYYGRYAFLTVQVALFVVISVYSIIASFKNVGRDRTCYRTVFASGTVMALFIILQSFAPFLPFYAVGCLISNCFIHVFIEEDEKREKDRVVRDFKTKQRYSITFGQIAESLALNYDVIYYVDIETEEYVGYTSQNIYGELKIEEDGVDFFAAAKTNSEVLLHPNDREKMQSVMKKDFLLSALEGRRQFTHECRIIVDGKAHHTRLVARKSSDAGHIIICVENIDDEVQKVNEHFKALNTERELARRDELTGTKNKTAFGELEASVQSSINKGVEDLSFAIVVCDLNDLKKMNDTKGHKAGDDYIIASAKIICELFDHSPVFRIGGDEFAIFLRGEDYLNQEAIMERMREMSEHNHKAGEGPVIAAGIAKYDPSNDSKFEEVFERADRLMYEDKRNLKGKAG